MTHAKKLMEPEAFHNKVLEWFDRYGRKDLPWKQGATPYHIWISEIMLQQTQVATVIPYYQNFIVRFPDVQALAAATLDSVLHAWSGLGYYARARNLHKSAVIIAGQPHFPDTFEEWIRLPGIGRSTAGAVLSMAFNKQYPILDGNVRRVLARFHAVEGWPGRSSVSKELWRYSEIYTPKTRVADYTQAMMDLGAKVCRQKTPDCDQCPLDDECQAYLENKVSEFPGSRPGKQRIIRQSAFLLLTDHCDQIYLVRRPPHGIWGGLWCLPEFSDSCEALDWCLTKNFEVIEKEIQSPREHDFSHFKLQYTPVRVKTRFTENIVLETDHTVWYKLDQLHTLGLPAPLKRLLEQNFYNTRGKRMTRMVQCAKLEKEAEGLDNPPFPGPKGQKIFETISREAWQEWLGMQTVLINEHRLASFEPKARKFLEDEREKFLYGSGIDLPDEFKPT